MPSIPKYLQFFIDKTKDPNTNWIFENSYPEISGLSKKNKKWKPCSNCKKAIPIQHEYEFMYGKAFKCKAWEKPNANNSCSHYESKYYNSQIK